MNLKSNSLNESLKRFRMLMEYDFYVPENYEEFEGDGLIGEDDPIDDEDSLGDSSTNDSEDSFGDEEIPDEEGGEENPMGDESNEPIDLSGDEAPIEEPVTPAPPVEDEVELDVTELVQGTKDAKASSDMANQQIANLIQQFDSLGAKLNQIDALTQKLDGLEHEIEKRNPTEQEKLEMRSLNSYPYNLKLTDYWAEKEGQYDVMNQNGQKEPKEFVLTQDDVDADYNQSQVKNSFDENEFEEEDI